MRKIMAITKTKAGTYCVDVHFFDAQGKDRRKRKTFCAHKDAVLWHEESRALARRGQFVALQETSQSPLAIPLNKLLGPCVYIVKEGGTDAILYIGMSARGIGRIADRTHSVHGKLEGRKNIMVEMIFT